MSTRQANQPAPRPSGAQSTKRLGDFEAVQRADHRALTEVALDALRAGLHERITTSVQMQERLDVGSGTVQKAIRQLVSAGALRLRVKGHQGTVIEELDAAMLWRAAELGPLRLALTPPGSIETSAIALELRAQLLAHEIPLEIDYARGASRRLELLSTDEPRVAVLSKVAADGLGVLDDSRYATLDLGDLTYYRPETLMIVRRHDTPSDRTLRIARDRGSYDHDYLTTLEFPESEGYDYVDCAYTNVPAAVILGAADAGVWHSTVAPISPAEAGLDVEPINPERLRGEDISHAVIAWRSEYPEIFRVLELVDMSAIARRQSSLASRRLDRDELRDSIPWF